MDYERLVDAVQGTRLAQVWYEYKRSAATGAREPCDRTPPENTSSQRESSPVIEQPTLDSKARS